MSSGTKTRDDFLEQLDLLGFVREYRFHPTRKWRCDAALPDDDVRVCVEYDGFVGASQGYGNVGHTSINGMKRDGEKANELALMGWILIRVNAETVKNGKAIEWVIRALEQRGREIA
jgi:hypothetical protein